MNIDLGVSGLPSYVWADSDTFTFLALLLGAVALTIIVVSGSIMVKDIGAPLGLMLCLGITSFALLCMSSLNASVRETPDHTTHLPTWAARVISFNKVRMIDDGKTLNDALHKHYGITASDAEWLPAPADSASLDDDARRGNDYLVGDTHTSCAVVYRVTKRDAYGQMTQVHIDTVACVRPSESLQIIKPRG